LKLSIDLLIQSFFRLSTEILLGKRHVNVRKIERKRRKRRKTINPSFSLLFVYLCFNNNQVTPQCCVTIIALNIVST
jgi:hypothetical protein